METRRAPNSELTPADEGREDVFVTTRWTLVRRAGHPSAGAHKALEEICQTYWFPLYAYVRRRGHSPEDAEDLTQEFFRQLLEHRWLEQADREKGRLRSFLITALKRYMAKAWRKASAEKRGGGARAMSIDAEVAEGRYADANHPGLDAEALFDRQWALAVLEATFDCLESEFSTAKKRADYAVLKETLALSRDTLDYADLAARLNLSEGAARVATHRIRKRFRKIYRDEVAATLPPGADLDEEARYLAEKLTLG